MGVEVFADAQLVVPKVLAQNGGYDAQDMIVKLQVIFNFFDSTTSSIGGVRRRACGWYRLKDR